GISSAGRAPGLQPGGHRFEPGILHQPSPGGRLACEEARRSGAVAPEPERAEADLVGFKPASGNTKIAASACTPVTLMQQSQVRASGAGPAVRRGPVVSDASPRVWREAVAP